MVNRFTTLFSPAPAQNPAAAPVRNTQSAYANMPVAGGAVRYSQPAATQRNTYQPASGGFSAPQPRRDVVQSLISLAGQRNAPLRNLGISPAAVAPLNRMATAPTSGFNNIPVVGNLMARSAAAQVAETLMGAAQRTQAQQQQSQLFDQQIQFTKAQADPVAWMDPAYPAMMDKRAQQIEQMRVGFENAAPLRGAPPQPGYNVLSSANAGSQRSSKQQQASLAFPQMSDAEIDRLSPQQLDSLLALKPVNADQYRYEPINRTQGSTQAGQGAKVPEPGTLTAQQESQLFDIHRQGMKLEDQAYEDGFVTPAERRRYSETFESERELREQFRIAQGGKPGTTLGDVLSYDFGKPVGDAIKEYGGAAVEGFLNSPVGKPALWSLEQLDGPYQWNVTKSGDQWYNAATGNYAQGDGRVTSALGPLGDVLAMSPDTAIALAFYAANPDLKDGVIAAYENGYSSPGYIALMEEAEVADYPPQFGPGGFAVHEYLIGQTDDWPPALRDAVRLGEGVVMDPLTYLTIVGGTGKGIRAVGKALATAEDSSTFTRVAGRGLEATGGALEIGAKAPDMVFEAPISGYNWWTRRGGRAPGKPGFAQLSTDQQIMDEHTQAAHAAGLISRNTDAGAGQMPSAATVAADLERAQAAVPPRSTVEAQADAADGLDVPEAAVANEGPDAPEPQVARPDEDAPTAGAAPTSTVPEPPGRVVEEYQVQRIADPPTAAAATDSVTRPAAPLRTADQVPAEAPAVRAAVERYNTEVDTTGRVGTTYFTPVYGGSRLPDAPITRAVVSGDLDAIARANELAEVFEPMALPLLQDDPVTGTWFRGWDGQGGINIAGDVAIPNRSFAQDAALESMVSRSGGRLAAPYRAAQMTKELLEHAAELKVLAEAYAPLYREIMGEAPVNREGDALFGYTWTPVGPDGLPIPGIQRAQYLMERFVFTSSDEYANYIRALWNDPNYQGAGVLNITDGPKPYLQGIPDSVRADVLAVLEDARAAYKAAARSSDEDFASGAWRKGLNPTGKPTSAVQLGGGLKGSSKSAEKLAEKWIDAAEPKRTTPTPAEAWANSPTRAKRKPKNALGFAEKDPVADVLLNEKGELRAKGSLGRKFDQVQRPADDTAVANVKNPVLRFLNETAAPGFDRKTTEYLNTDLPGWHPPGTKPGQVGLWEPSEWTVFDALQWGNAHKKANPEFDYEGFVNDIGERAAGIPPKMTPAEQKVAIRLAKANGEEVPKFRDVENQRSAAHKAARGYDKYLTQIRQSSLFGPISGPAGFIGDVIGNTWAAIVNGHFGTAFDVMRPDKTIGAGRTFRATRTPVEYVNPMEMQSAADGYAIFSRNAHQAADAMMTDVLRETGQLLPTDMYPAGTLREVPVSGKPSLNAAVEGRNPVIRGLANLWTVPAIKDGRTATDLVGRTSLTKRVYRDSIKRDAIPAFRKLVAQHAGQANVDQVMRDILAAAEQRAKDAGVAWKGNFSPADVKKATEGQSYSNPLARGWQSELNRSLDLAMAEQKRVYFSYKNTKADEVVGSIFMFHYWQTRASYMHLRAALRNPVLLNGYYKIFEELKERNEAGGVGYLGPIYKFMTSPSGIYAGIDPLGLLIPTTLIDMQDQEGSKLRVLQNQLNPIIGSALAIAGITDNIPNVTGLRTTERWLINMGNYLTAEGVDMASVPLLGRIWDKNTMRLSLPIDEAVKTILQEMNQWWADKGIPVGEFAPFDRGANEKDQLNTWVLKGVEAQYGPMDLNAQTGPWAAGGEAWQAMDDAIDALTTGVPNPIADEAERQYAMEGFIQAALAPVVPGGVITRSGYRDEQIAGNAADDPAASLNRDLAKSGSTTWDIMQQQYNQIGTPDEQRIYQDYIALTMNPEDIGTVVSRTPSGQLTVLRQSQISAMSDEEREDFINRWIAANPGYEAAILKVQSGRDAFKAANPQFGEFKEYQKFMYDEEGKGVRALRTTLEKENPNFGRKIKEYRDYLKSQGVTGAELERRLDSWAAGVDGYRAFMGIPLTNDDKPIAVYDPSQNPYASSAFAGFGADGSGGSGGSSAGKPKADEDEESTIHDPYWEPDKVAQRLADDVAKYDTVNQTMEQRFGDAWNAQAAEWEDHADSSSERKKLGLDGIPYEYPKKSDLMVAYESWAYDNPGKPVDQWFDWLMNAPGYGAAGDPATTLNYGPKEATATATATAPASGNRFTQLGDKLAQPSPPSGLPGVSWLPSVGSKPEENDDAQQMLSVARSYVGQVPYVWGGIPGKGQDPSGGWDCSGMVYWLDQNYGSGNIPMGSHYQYQYAIDSGKLFTDMKKLQPGDVVFIDTGWYGGAGGDINPAGHVGIYAGNGQLINATNATQGTVIQPISDYGNILGAMHGSW